MPQARFYMRVSTGDQSVEQQRPSSAAYYEYALAPRGLGRGGEYVDLGVSASVPFRSRPEGERCCREAEPGDAIVVAKLDRAFRDTKDCLETADVLAARRVALHLLDVPVQELTSAMGRMCLTMAAAFAEFERGRMAERMRDSIRARRAAGRHATGTAPYGARVVGVRGARRLVPDPRKRQIGQAVVAWKDQGWTWEQIYWHLRREGVRHPTTQAELTLGLLRLWYTKERNLAAEEARRAAQREKKEDQENGCVHD